MTAIDDLPPPGIITVGYCDVICVDGPCEGTHIPVRGRNVGYGFMLQVPFFEYTRSAPSHDLRTVSANGWTRYRERIAIYKGDGYDRAMFVGVLES